ncbi:hypothetical protein BX589_102363 [Paraburkholderia fungorum]|uniref:hypothetical protein n=1 Tax=Paraburkholderia fungorum TaxID=134537 RepID=UPI000D04FCB3|nr:hypothetical protein [Paraburkholderia fungorum]PRZ56162.1 hypothetical protein BX589_102363 [Paraburkholderia fungorum]
MIKRLFGALVNLCFVYIVFSYVVQNDSMCGNFVIFLTACNAVIALLLWFAVCTDHHIEPTRKRPVFGFIGGLCDIASLGMLIAYGHFLLAAALVFYFVPMAIIKSKAHEAFIKAAA